MAVTAQIAACIAAWLPVICTLRMCDTGRRQF
jgi:hypothetical protein